MRKFYAWLLLIVSTTQWIGGHICFEVKHFIEVKAEMSQSELAISDDIFHETGVETSVNLLPEQHQVRWGADYANYFAFSKTDSVGTVYFTIDYAPRTTTWEDVAPTAPSQQDKDTAPLKLLKSLFADFLFPTIELPKTDTQDVATANFQLQGLKCSFCNHPSSPPPDHFYC